MRTKLNMTRIVLGFKADEQAIKLAEIPPGMVLYTLGQLGKDLNNLKIAVPPNIDRTLLQSAYLNP